MSFLSRLRDSFSHVIRKDANDMQKRQIEAGAGGRRWQGSSVLAAPQQSILAARTIAGQRATALCFNNPTASRAVEVMVSNLVGRGWQATSQHPDPATRRKLNADFETIMLPLLPLAARALVREGEAVIRMGLADMPGEGVSAPEFHARVLAGGQLDGALTRDLGNGQRILAGVELDLHDRPVAYHILPEAPGNPFGGYGPAIRLPARDVLHVFDQIVPGQVRGITWLAPVLLKLADQDAASDAMLMALKVQSLITGFIKDPEGGSAGFEATGAAADVSLEPGAMRIIPPQADVVFSQPGQGLSQPGEFIKGQFREIAAGIGLTYEQLTGDMSGTNYSSARVAMLEFRRRCEMLQRTVIEAQILRPLWRRWIEARALTGELAADPQSMADFFAVKFVPPGWQWVDPLKETNADIAAINAGLKSRAEVVAERGRALDELDEERAADADAPQPNPNKSGV